LEREPDVRAEAGGSPGSRIGSLHASRPCSRHDHPAGSRDLLAEPPGLLVVRITGTSPRGAEHAYLPNSLVCAEDLERVAHLADGGVDDLEIQAGRTVLGQAQAGHEDAGDELG